MPTLMIFHEVDDVEHWLSRPNREEEFGPLGITVRTFVDPAKSNRVGLIAQVPTWNRSSGSWSPKWQPKQ